MRRAEEGCSCWGLGPDEVKTSGVSLFQLTVRVFDRSTKKELDNPLPFSIIIDDMNDNAPTFTDQMLVTVLEKSKAGEEHHAAG